MASYHHCHHPTPTPCCYPIPPPDPHLHHHHPPPPYSIQTHLPNPLQNPPPHFQQFQFQDQTNISALLRRIAALETALRRRSSSSPSTALRHAAAQTIQTHFRAFLLSRSRTLRQLKELACIKSQLGLLKLSVSERALFDYDGVYRKARALLVKLAAIQGCDPMIRDGKASVSKDLNRFLDYLDGFVVERMEISSGVNVRGVRRDSKLRVLNSARKMDNTGGKLKRVSEEKLRGLVERIDKLAVELDEEEDEEVGSPVRSNLNSRVLSSARKMNNRNYGGLKSVNVEKLSSSVDRNDKLAELDEEEDEEIGSPVGSDLHSRILSIAQKMGNYKLGEPKPTSLPDEPKIKFGGSIVQPSERRRVSFAQDGKAFRSVRKNHEPSLDEEDCREVEEIGLSSKEAGDDEDGECQSDDGGSSHWSEGDLRSYRS